MTKSIDSNFFEKAIVWLNKLEVRLFNSWEIPKRLLDNFGYDLNKKELLDFYNNISNILRNLSNKEKEDASFGNLSKDIRKKLFKLADSKVKREILSSYLRVNFFKKELSYNSFVISYVKEKKLWDKLLENELVITTNFFNFSAYKINKYIKLKWIEPKQGKDEYFFSKEQIEEIFKYIEEDIFKKFDWYDCFNPKHKNNFWKKTYKEKLLRKSLIHYYEDITDVLFTDDKDKTVILKTKKQKLENKKDYEHEQIDKKISNNINNNILDNILYNKETLGALSKKIIHQNTQKVSIDTVLNTLDVNNLIKKTHIFIRKTLRDKKYNYTDQQLKEYTLEYLKKDFKDNNIIIKNILKWFVEKAYIENNPILISSLNRFLTSNLVKENSVYKITPTDLKNPCSLLKNLNEEIEKINWVLAKMEKNYEKLEKESNEEILKRINEEKESLVLKRASYVEIEKIIDDYIYTFNKIKKKKTTEDDLKVYNDYLFWQEWLKKYWIDFEKYQEKVFSKDKTPIEIKVDALDKIKKEVLIKEIESIDFLIMSKDEEKNDFFRKKKKLEEIKKQIEEEKLKKSSKNNKYVKEEIKINNMIDTVSNIYTKNIDLSKLRIY